MIVHDWPTCNCPQQQKAWTPLIFSCRKRGSTDFYRPQRSCEGYVFTPVWLSAGGGGGGLPQCMLGYHHHPLLEQAPPREQAPPWSRHPPRADTPPGRWLLLRTVRILLECILVNIVLFNLRYLAGNCTFLYKKYFSKIYLHQYSESHFYWIAGPFGLVEKMTISLTMSPGHMPKNPYLQSCGGIPMDLNITKEIVSILTFPNTNWMFITVINTCIMFVKSNMHWNNATY